MPAVILTVNMLSSRVMPLCAVQSLGLRIWLSLIHILACRFCKLHIGGKLTTFQKRPDTLCGALPRNDLGRPVITDRLPVGKMDTIDRKSTRLNSSHSRASRMPSSA